MIHSLAKCFNQCKKHIEINYDEIDYWEMVCFEKINNNIK